MEFLKWGWASSSSAAYKHLRQQSHCYTQAYCPADIPAQLGLNCSGYSDYYINLNSVLLFLRIHLVTTDGSNLASAKSNTVRCVNNLLHFPFSSLSVSLNGQPITLHMTNYHYEA